MTVTDSAPLFMGIDGGGTSCRVRLADAEGRILANARAGSANVYQSAEVSWASIDQATEDALSQAGLPGEARGRIEVVAGLAGSEIDSAATRFLARPHGFSRFHLLNDGQIACVGAHAGEDGAMLVVGTGIIGIAHHENEWRRVSGWGFPLDDRGSGAWIGQQAVRYALWQNDGLVSPSGMTEAVWEQYSGSMGGLIGWAQEAKSVDYGKLAPLVVDWYEKSDPHAVRIVERQMKVINDLLDALQQPPQPLVVLGGLGPFVSARLAERHQAQLRPSQGDALDGALRLALQRSLD